MDLYNADLKTLSEKFVQKPKTFHSRSENGEEKASTTTNDSSQNVSMVPMIAVLTTVPNESEEKPSSLSWMSEKDNEFFLQEKNSNQKVPVDLYKAVLKTLSESFVQKSQKIRSISENGYKTFFSKKMNLLKMFPWTSRTQFWQPRQKTFDKITRIFRSMFKNDIKQTFFRG